MSTPLVLVGGSGFGREALDSLEAHNRAHPDRAWQLLGVADDGPSDLTRQRLAERGIDLLGGLNAVLARDDVRQYLLGIGSPQVRRRLVSRFDEQGWRAPQVVDPRASIGSLPRWDDGTVVCAGVQVSTNVRLGRHVHLNPNATIGHDAVLEDFVSVNPGAIVSGEVTLGSGTLVGAGAIVLQGLSVGRDVVLGAGCVVTKNVPDGVVVKGIPGVWS